MWSELRDMQSLAPLPGQMSGTTAQAGRPGSTQSSLRLSSDSGRPSLDAQARHGNSRRGGLAAGIVGLMKGAASAGKN